jgi:integrase
LGVYSATQVEIPPLLTDLTIRRSKPKSKPYKLFHEKGLYLLINPNGSKYWRIKYRFSGKEKTLALGVYPEVTLSEATDQLANARTLIRNGSDPSLEKKREKLQQRISSDTTFEHVAKQWFALKGTQWRPSHFKRVKRSLELNIFPFIGSMPIEDIEAPLLRSVIEPIEKRGALDIAARVRQRCSSIFHFGIASGLCKSNPAESLKVVMTPPKRGHYPALPEEEMPTFLAKIHAYDCNLQTKLAIRMMLLTFVRTVELIEARWEEFKFEDAIWLIPPNRMKLNRPHYVPLAHQTVECLQQLQAITGNYPYLFPKRGTTQEPMSNSTILRVIDRIGYKGRMTGHGFRSVASTILNESAQFDFDVIERQLSHEDKDDVRAAYNRSKYLPERRRMMQWWADRVDQMEQQSLQ